MLVKICGIQTIDSAQAAVEASADYIGLVFAESKRKVSIEQARDIKESLSDSAVKVVGVFRHQPLAEVNQISQAVRLDYVQLHGDETLEECRQLNTPLIKALSFNKISQAILYQDVAEYILIDSPKPGSGEPFDWSAFKNEELMIPFFLAGGLSPENVKEAIQQVKPIGVDVSSGVETNGQKDNEKIRQFTHQAKQIKETISERRNDNND
ncbi:phosphoribosylanthranilate isomerase [Alkalibacterium olivapovliticus]|uniref:N-(5'-phosphoribosyl)anthranilate isomerase n=1 Tax=Alkalibacterium olivapovliticus TaxID=99907 RepID=A0A2T0W3V5_9LACT|nr:phosphoribosylanthranilate isomerase [Alkalibacterium olivapovliticus]PRY80071.1 phosphoribosylanthranilate isomerase [Alkalibacterium olivapovliticus]